jgi:hypothetical protein
MALFLQTKPLIRNPSLNETIGIIGRVFAVLEDVKGPHKGRVQIFEGYNIVCNDGDLYYAQMAADETPDNDFTGGGLKLGTGSTAPTKSDTDIETYIADSYKAVSDGYPKTNDDDGNNGGAGTDIVTWKYFYDTTEVNENGINECAICSDSSAPPTAILNHAHFSASFDKDNSQTLTVFVNHTFNGT